MGLENVVTKEYMRENEVFADAFNYLIYDGRAVLDPEKLHEMDATELAVLDHLQDNGKKKDLSGVEKQRDVLRSAVIKEDDKAAYVILGIENQTDIHYAMPVRNMIYDALQYGRQVTDISAKHRANKGDSKDASRAEYLSGFYKEDELLPVITMVIHFGADEWDGPLSLHAMMKTKDETILSFVQNYQIHLIDPAKMRQRDLEKLSSSLREVLGYIKYSKDKEQLLKFIDNNPRMRMEAGAAKVIQAVTNTKIEIPENAEVVDVCKAVEDLMEDSREEGIKKGRKEGREEGIKKGREEGREEGIKKGREEGREEGIKRGREEGRKQGQIETLAGLVLDGKLDIKIAVASAGMTEQEFETEMEKMKR